MAVPRKKTSKSKKNMRRAHLRTPAPTVVYCECGEPSLPHRVCDSCGQYKGRQFLTTADA